MLNKVEINQLRPAFSRNLSIFCISASVTSAVSMSNSAETVHDLIAGPNTPSEICPSFGDNRSKQSAMFSIYPNG